MPTTTMTDAEKAVSRVHFTLVDLFEDLEDLGIETDKGVSIVLAKLSEIANGDYK